MSMVQNQKSLVERRLRVSLNNGRINIVQLLLTECVIKAKSRAMERGRKEGRYNASAISVSTD